MEPQPPVTGQLVRVRSRQYLVEDVVPPPAPGDDTLVRLACLDDDAQGEPLQVLWEHEVDAEALTGANALRIADRGFDRANVFSSYLHALRWNCVSATNPRLFQAPYRAGIEVMAFQLEPLRKALLLPRVNLFIADDVGLGKTIEAGLILRELMLRQKVRRVVVSCPPSVVLQWRDELEQRFGLTFVVFDRDYVARKRRERGFGINPWATHSRFIISQALLRDEAYAGPLRDWITSDDHLAPQLREPAIFILDEAHNAAPASASKYAIDSKLTKVVRELAPLFEHRLFLSATPHNGHSNSFSALLEILDPHRFCRGVKVTRKNVESVVVRRLKDDLREIGVSGFPKRSVIQIDIDGLPADAPDLALARMLDRYRELRESKLTAASKSARAAAGLVVISLQKRLLSSIEAFASTLRVHRKALERARTKHAVAPLDRSLFDAPGPDDERGDEPEDEVQEREDTELAAASSASMVAELAAEERELLDAMSKIAEAARGETDPRVKRLLGWIREHCFTKDGRWNDRRVLLFTEYADTKRYLEAQLRAAFDRTDRGEDRIAVFHGGMADEAREDVKRAFNGAPDEHPLRILVATDAAREGVNLQNYCADLFHFDVPWNPSRMEQRNGRIDRKLQRSPEVRCHYFVFRQRPEDRVLETLVKKTKTIQTELGSLSQVLEARLSRVLEGGIRHREIDRLETAIRDETIERERLDAVDDELEAATRARREQLTGQIDELRSLMKTAQDAIGFDEDAFRDALSASLGLVGVSALKQTADGSFQIGFDDRLMRDPTWVETLDTLRAPRARGEKVWDWRKTAPIRTVAFRDSGSLDNKHVHLHLEHRLVRRLLGRFLAQGFLRDDISRATAVLTSDPIPRVVLLGRLSLFGEHGSRLHDEIIAIAARWTDPVGRKEPLKPYAEDAKARTLDLVEHALHEAREVAEPTRGKIMSLAERDFSELERPLAALAAERGRRAAAELTRRGDKESKEMVELLEQQTKRIAAQLDQAEKRDPKLQLDLFNEDEKKQLDADVRHWKKRLGELESDLKLEPIRVREGYETHAQRVEPVGLVYLWPVTG